MAINRAPFNLLVDEPPGGDGSIGTKWNKTQIQGVLLDPIDAEIARLDTHQYDTIPATRTDTGTVHNWAPGLVGNTFSRWAGGADLTVTGLAGGVAGQRWTFKNTGAKVAYFPHANGGSVAVNQFANAATSAPTPVAGGGWITYEHDGVVWQVIAHSQGAWVSATFSSANFRSGASGSGWAVAAGNVSAMAYFLSGRLLDIAFSFDGTSVNPVSVELQILNAAYGGFAAVGVQYNDPIAYVADAGTVVVGCMGQVNANGTAIRLLKPSFANWQVSASATAVYGKSKIGVV